MIAFGQHYSKACQYGYIIIISTAGALRIGVVRDPSVRPLIAFEYLSLYIQKHLGQSVAVFFFVQLYFETLEIRGGGPL